VITLVFSRFIGINNLHPMGADKSHKVRDKKHQKRSGKSTSSVVYFGRKDKIKKRERVMKL